MLTPPADWLPAGDTPDIFDKWDDRWRVSALRLERELVEDDDESVRVFGSSAVFGKLRDLMREEETDTVVLVRGFAADFETALKRAAEIKVGCRFDAARPLNVFLFSWPSDGEMLPYLSYFRDRDDAEQSGKAIARAFPIFRRRMEAEIAAGRICDQRVHLLAHSMGNHALRHAIRPIRRYEDPSRLRRIFLRRSVSSRADPCRPILVRMGRQPWKPYTS
jgi:hypothetical protein